MATTPEWPPNELSRSSYPELGHEVEYLGPNVLTSTFNDGSQAIRVKSNRMFRRYRERWVVNRSDAAILLRFFEEMGLDASFTKRGLEAGRTLNDYQNYIVIVRFEAVPTIEHIGPNTWELEFTFRQTEL